MFSHFMIYIVVLYTSGIVYYECRELYSTCTVFVMKEVKIVKLRAAIF